MEKDKKLPADADDVAWKGEVCLLYTSDAADERSSVDLGGRRIIKKKKMSGHEEWNKPVRQQMYRTGHSETI